MTFGEILKKFREQFPYIVYDDSRPTNHMTKLYLWIKNSPVNLIVEYKEDTDTFIIESTREEWNIENA